MSPDVHALTGAYALDAVNDLERVEFERHLFACPACAQEVRELRETAVRLGHAAAAMPPPALKGRVMANITRVRQLPPEVALVGPAARGRWALRLTSAAAAVLLVVSAVLGVLLVRERQAGEEGRTLAAVLEATDSKVVTGDSSTGGTATMIVSRSQGRAVLLADLPELPSDQVYQAWLIGGPEEVRSAGLLQGRILDVGAIETAESIGLTVEPAGGSARPSQLPPIVNLPVAT